MNKNNLSFSFYSLIEIRFADPVSALELNDKMIIIGTMMGRIAVLSLQDKKSTLLAELSSENITGITFETNDTFSVAVGDEEVLKYKINVVNGQQVQDYVRLKNYDNEANHKNKCDSCFTLLSKEYLLMVYLNHSNENNLTIQMQSTQIRIKNILTNSIDEGAIEMTNYSVPFDFDGSRFAWVEFLSEKERNICVFYVENNTKWQYALNKDFGHISHCKLLPDNKLLIVRNLVVCEIRNIDRDFTKVHEFKHIGDEVIAVDFYFNNAKLLVNEMELDNIQINKNNDVYIKIPAEKNTATKDKEMVNIGNNENEENMTIVLLDIDGNVNSWENFTLKKLFNLYDIKDINDEYKKKQFFSMGYPYYIKANQYFYSISSDHGVFVIKKQID